jgi:class 3 adenylate cyclase
MSTAEQRHAAFLAIELRNFTRLAEMLEPAKVLELANDCFSLVAMAVSVNRGKPLSVLNDMLLAAFSSERKDFAERALKAAQDVKREFGAMGEQRKTRDGLAAVSCALHLGDAVFGKAGPIGAQHFVAFGDCVSMTVRLVHRARAGEIILSADFVNALGPAAKSMKLQALPALELTKRPPIALYGLPLEPRLELT